MIDRKKIIDEILPTTAYGCYFRLVEIEDAEFILSLRNNEKLARYINRTSSKLEDQINWLKEYKIREKEGKDLYFMCLKEDKKTRLGLNRLYDISGDICEYGSWLYGPEAVSNEAVLGDLFIKSLAYEKLGFKTLTMSTMKKNISVMRYTKSFNPRFIKEDEISEYFELEYDDWDAQRKKYLKIFLKEDKK
ncbi:GNAT family N-acetyltransferase [Maribacter sp. TH_r10]|uniref:GNAT family N-acetyltransferase n=1 Tax=Maribacter sp. TH_r10 TaxID=3082086 RepID=UPI002953508E|nr:GNAT family N-acetyltransferase [Maribacter sp. TH_r10]MDV7140126.1 GNAT family N-acetyltransferase [Maribacter sp. TH_r10]